MTKCVRFAARYAVSWPRTLEHGEIEYLVNTMTPNKPDAPNAAITLKFHVEHQWRGVGDPRGRSGSHPYI